MNSIPQDWHSYLKCIVPFFLIALLGSCGSTGPDIKPTIEGQFEVSDGNIFLQCYGEEEAAPTVILMHGIGNNASSKSWNNVVNKPLPDAFVCRYDRAGTGKSQVPDKKGRTGNDIVTNFKALIDVAGLSDPFLLVGHSFGGYPVRLFASEFPKEVAGAIFVDSIHEQIGLLKATGKKNWGQIPQANEQLDLQQVETKVAQSNFPETLPVLVVTRGKGVSADWSAAQDSLLGISDNSRQRIANGSGHEIPMEKPNVVITAIEDLLNGDM